MNADHEALSQLQTPGQGNVLGGETADVVGGEAKGDAVVGDGDVGVVALSLGRTDELIYKSNGFVETLEGVGAA
jgi:hypothetical protein